MKGRVIFRCEPQFETMSMPLEQLEAEALELPIRERASLAYRLLESLNENATEDPVETECRLAGNRTGQISGHTDQESATLSEPDTKARYTPKQGRYLSFIYYYTKIHGLPPSEADMQRYFRVSPPAVHQMILNLQARGLIERVPRAPRSVRLTVPRSDLPDLE
jgi:DNA-binding MarR family transcriptional regulator